MESRSRLVYVPGIPFRCESLMPQRALASMAACLLEGGHETRILDWGTVGGMKRFGVPGLRAAAGQVAAGRERRPGAVSRGRLAGLWQLRALEALCQESLHARRQEVLHELARAGELDFVVFLINTREDLREAWQVGAWVRERFPRVSQVAAGAYVDDYGAIILSAGTGFDCAVVNDTEIALPALAERIHEPRRWSALPNLICREEGGVVQTDCEVVADLDKLPSPRYDVAVYPALRDGQKFRLFTLEHSRGGSRGGYGAPVAPWPAQLVRVKSPRALCTEMGRLTHALGVRAFHLSGEQTPHAHVNRLACEMLARSMCIEYSRLGQVAYTDPAALRNLASSGCRAVCFRLGTGSQRLLEDFYGYDVTVSGAERVLRACWHAGLFAVAQFSYPCPQDDYHTREELLRLVVRGRPRSVIVSAPELRPRSAWWQRPVEFGYRVDHEAYARWVAARDADGPCLGREGELPYRLAGWSRSRRIAAQKALLSALDDQGVWTGISERVALMARLAGYEGEEAAFYARLQRSLFAVDGRDIAELAALCNRSAMVAANAGMSRPFMPTSVAVGN